MAGGSFMVLEQYARLFREDDEPGTEVRELWMKGLQGGAIGGGKQSGSEDAQGDDGLIVGQGRCAAEGVDVFEDGIGYLLRRLAAGRSEESLQAFAAVLVAAVELILDAVGVEQEQVAGLSGDGDLFVFLIFEQADGDAVGVGIDEGAVAAENGGQSAGIGKRETQVGGVPDQQGEGGVLGIDFALEQGFVHELHQLGGAAAAWGEDAQESGDESAVEGGGGALAADVTEGDESGAVLVLEEVVEIAADFAGGAAADADFKASNIGCSARQQDALQAEGGVQILLHALF